jgi:hypothetical protein
MAAHIRLFQNPQIKDSSARAFASLRNKVLENPWKKHDNIPL